MAILVLVLLILILGGGGGLWGRRAGWGPRGWGGGLVAMVLLVILAVWLINEITMPPLPMPSGVPPISRPG